MEITQEALDAAVAKATTDATAAANTAHATATEGLTSKNTTLLDELKIAKAGAKKFDGIDLDALQALKATVEGDRVLKLMSEGKHDEAIEAATEILKVTHSAEMDTLNTQLTELKESGAKDTALVQELLIDGGAKAAFLAVKGLPTAVDDIANRAREVWSVENGTVIARDGDGQIVQGEKGPLTMSEWADGLKKSAPHLFPSSETGGAGGGGGGGGGGNAGGLDAQILEASANKDFPLMRKLNKQKREAAG